MSRRIITLTTDFGEGSGYVAEMKGVMLSLQPEAQIVDISHAVPPQDIRAGAFLLAQATAPFPPDSIHVAVVDPGVGTARRLAYARIDGRHYLAPDNGLLGLLVRRHAPAELIALTNDAFWRRPVSATFHGRDILAPVAAHLSRGVAPGELGQPLADLVPLAWPEAIAENDRAVGEVCMIDAFGNLITNLSRELVANLGPSRHLHISCAGRTVRGLVHTYGDARSGELVALFGSQGWLELAIVGGSAKSALACAVGERVVASVASWTTRGEPLQ